MGATDYPHHHTNGADTPMRIALSSAPVRTKQIPQNIAAMTAALAQAAADGADLVALGESTLQGFDCLCWSYETDRDMAVPLDSEPIRMMQDAARQHAIAVAFGFIERDKDELYNSYAFIGADGEIIHRFRRVSIGWKEYQKTDDHYREGMNFEKFEYGGKTFAIGLCGDLWTDGRPAEMHALDADVVLWGVWCDYRADEWNSAIKHEYAEQAQKCGARVLLVNPYCADDADDVAAGGAADFRDGKIQAELPAGKCGMLIVDV